MYVTNTKTCSQCGQEKPLNEYSPQKKGKCGLKANCRACSNEYCRAYYERNRQKFSDRHLQRKYSLTRAELDAMIVQRNGCCDICGKPSNLVVDHCHDTGKVRGLLCGTCNQGLGKLGDSVETVRKAVEYLEG